jgi:hypothetical protein
MQFALSSRVSVAVGTGLGAAALVGGVVAAPSAAAGTNRQDDVLTTFNSIVIQGKTGFDTRTGKTVELAPAKVINNLVDAVTGAVVGAGSMKSVVMEGGPADSLRSCIKSTERPGLTAYAPSTKYVRFENGSVQFQYHAYRLAGARKVGVGNTTQWEVCSKGGGDLDSGRLRRVGTGMALADQSVSRRIGYAWQTGKTPEDYSLGLGFKVERKPVSINASITQNPSDRLLGSFRAPYDSYMNDVELNAVNAWWQDNCIGRWYGCFPNSGSQDFQGAIAHGLWEFPVGTEPGIVAFHFTPYLSK